MSLALAKKEQHRLLCEREQAANDRGLLETGQNGHRCLPEEAVSMQIRKVRLSSRGGWRALQSDAEPHGDKRSPSLPGGGFRCHYLLCSPDLDLCHSPLLPHLFRQKSDCQETIASTPPGSSLETGAPPHTY